MVNSGSDMDKLIIQPKDCPNLGVYVKDIDYNDIARTFTLSVKYFALEEPIQMSDDYDFVMISYNDLMDTFNICNNWDTIRTISQAKWVPLRDFEQELLNEHIEVE